MWAAGHYGRFNVPLELLTKEEQALIETRGHEAVDNGFGLHYPSIPVEHFPSVFYNRKTTRINGADIPFYAQAFLDKPSFSRRFLGMFIDEGKEMEELVELASLFQKDFEEFPLELLFYENLFKLRGVDVVYDETVETQAVAEYDTRKVKFGKGSKPHLSDFAYVVVTLLHELYHFVEVGTVDSAVELWTPARWHLVKRGKRHDVFWKYEEFETETSHQLAEVLAALTYIRRPEILEEIRPYYNALNETINPQLLFPLSKRVWFEK